METYSYTAPINTENRLEMGPPATIAEHMRETSGLLDAAITGLRTIKAFLYGPMDDPKEISSLADCMYSEARAGVEKAHIINGLIDEIRGRLC